VKFKSVVTFAQGTAMFWQRVSRGSSAVRCHQNLSEVIETQFTCSAR